MMQGDRTGRALFLPWHQYMSLSFTGRRVVNPAPYYFSLPVVAGDNLGVPGIATQSTRPESRLVEAFLSNQGRDADQALPRLCIRWVVLANEVDAESYSWLDRLPGLHKAYEGPNVTLWRTKAAPSSHCSRI